MVFLLTHWRNFFAYVDCFIFKVWYGGISYASYSIGVYIDGQDDYDKAERVS